MDTSTKKELDAISDQLGQAKTRLETIRDDYQGYFDSMPEKWQTTEVANKIETDIDQLSEIIDHIDDLEGEVFELAKSINTRWTSSRGQQNNEGDP